MYGNKRQCGLETVEVVQIASWDQFPRLGMIAQAYEPNSRMHNASPARRAHVTRKLFNGRECRSVRVPVLVPMLGGILPSTRNIGQTNLHQWKFHHPPDPRLSAYVRAPGELLAE